MSEEPPSIDCLIIGGGPAGLTAATYLARFQRHIVLADADHSRARYIPVSHNCPGFPFGVSGDDLLTKMREQAAHFGVQALPVRIDRLEVRDGEFLGSAQSQSWRAKTVLLATGIKDRMPALDDLEQGIADEVMRICAICDGYEARDHRIAVYGPAADVVRHACFMRTFSRQVSVVLSEPGEISPADRQRATGLGVEVLAVPQSMRFVGDDTSTFTSFAFTWSGEERLFDTVYPVLGSHVKGHLASMIDAARDDQGELIVDANMQTSVDGCYAAGDAVSSVNQIAVAVGHAAIAAIAIHNRLECNPR